MDISNLKLNFMQYRKVAGSISVALILLSLLSLSTLQLEWGLDFTGGTLVEVSYNDPVVPQVIRNQLSEAGYEGHVVQYFGSDRDILVRVPPQKALNSRENASLGDRILLSLREESSADIILRRSEFVGPAVGEELTNQGGMGLLGALGMVLIYVAFRFQYKFAIGAVIALFQMS